MCYICLDFLIHYTPHTFLRLSVQSIICVLTQKRTVHKDPCILQVQGMLSPSPSPSNIMRPSPTVRRVPPRFSIPPTNHEVMPGGSVNLTCVAVGAPMPYVKWMRGEVELTKEEEMPIGRNVLELTNIRQSANYTCVAISSLGMIDTTAQITVKGKTPLATQDNIGFIILYLVNGFKTLSTSGSQQNIFMLLEFFYIPGCLITLVLSLSNPRLSS